MCFSDQSNVFQRTVLFFEIKTVLFLVQYNPRNSERMCDEHHSQKKSKQFCFLCSTIQGIKRECVMNIIHKI